MRPRKLFYRRAFLNKPRHQSVAMVLGEVNLAEGEMAANLTIGDCSRQVTLDFALWVGYGDHRKVRHDEVANLRHKSKVLRKTIGDFLDAVETGLLEFEAGEA